MAQWPSSAWGGRNTTVAWLMVWYVFESCSSSCAIDSTSSPLANGMGCRHYIPRNATATASRETVMMSSILSSSMHTCHMWTPAMWLRTAKNYGKLRGSLGCTRGPPQRACGPCHSPVGTRRCSALETTWAPQHLVLLAPQHPCLGYPRTARPMHGRGGPTL